jgi:hypothetical protein
LRYWDECGLANAGIMHNLASTTAVLIAVLEELVREYVEQLGDGSGSRSIAMFRREPP